MSESLSKFWMKIRKLWIIEVVINQIQIGNSVTYYTSSPSFALCIIFHKIMFSSLLMTEYIFVPCRGSIETYLQLLYLGCMYGWNFSWGKMKILDFFSTEQMEVELAWYVIELPICVWLITTSKILTSLFLIGICSNFHWLVSLIFLLLLKLT